MGYITFITLNLSEQEGFAHLDEWNLEAIECGDWVTVVVDVKEADAAMLNLKSPTIRAFVDTRAINMRIVGIAHPTGVFEKVCFRLIEVF